MMGIGLTGHSRKYNAGSNYHMPSLGKWSVFEEVLFNDFPTDVILQRDCTSVWARLEKRDVLVVDILAPKHSRAILTIKSSGEKLFNMFPSSSAQSYMTGEKTYFCFTCKDDVARYCHQETTE
jgi:hypothetical protein